MPNPRQSDVDNSGSGPKTGPVSGAYVLASALYNAGFRGLDLLVFTAISGRESGFNPAVGSEIDTNGVASSGPWQLNQDGVGSGFSTSYLNNPQNNADVVWEGSNHGSDLSPWALKYSGDWTVPIYTTNNLGQPVNYSIDAFKGAATTAVAQIYSRGALTPTQVASYGPGGEGKVGPSPGGTGGGIGLGEPTVTAANSGAGVLHNLQALMNPSFEQTVFSFGGSNVEAYAIRITIALVGAGMMFTGLWLIVKDIKPGRAVLQATRLQNLYYRPDQNKRSNENLRLRQEQFAYNQKRPSNRTGSAPPSPPPPPPPPPPTTPRYGGATYAPPTPSETAGGAAAGSGAAAGELGAGADLIDVPLILA